MTRNKEALWLQGQKIVEHAPQLYIDVDVEADGIAGYGSLLSLGAIAPSGEEYYSELRPRSDIWIPSNRLFCENHGLERERLMDEARPSDEVIEEFNEWTLELRRKTGKRAIFTAFNAGFDWGHVDLNFRLAGIENPYGVESFDTQSLANVLAPGWDWSRTDLSKLPFDIVPDKKFTHHALEDAKYQQKMHFGMAALLGTKYPGLVEVR